MRGLKTKAHILKNDIIDAALYIKKDIAKNPLILVLADPRTPGGSDPDALFSQEASIWRRTTLRENLVSQSRAKYFENKNEDSFVYEIPEHGVIYCPDVYVIRDGQKKGYAFRQPRKLSFICVSPIIKLCKKEEKERPELTPAEVEIVKKRISTIFLAAHKHDHDSIVLTAFGCGFASNRPKQIVEIFLEVIRDFRGNFAHIVFAILNNQISKKRNPNGNVQPFENTFNNMRLSKN